jgi:hypothetical protein
MDRNWELKLEVGVFLPATSRRVILIQAEFLRRVPAIAVNLWMN